MDDSSNNVLIDFNSPMKRDVELHTPLVPVSKDNIKILCSSEMDTSANNNPFDLVIEQININNQNDPFETVFKEALNSVDQNLEVKISSASSPQIGCKFVSEVKEKPVNGFKCHSTDVCMSEQEYYKFTPSVSPHCHKLNGNHRNLKQNIIEECISKKEVTDSLKLNSLFHLSESKLNRLGLGQLESEKMIFDESSSCINDVTDSLTNSESATDTLILIGQLQESSKSSDCNLLEERKRMGKLVEKELNRSLELANKSSGSVTTEQTDQSENIPGSRICKKLVTPIKGNVDIKTLIAERIEQCIQKGLNDSKSSLPHPRYHRRSQSSSVLGQDFQNIQTPVLNSSVSGLNLEGGAFSFSEQTIELYKDYTLNKALEMDDIREKRAKSLKNFSFSTPDTRLLERYEAVKMRSIDYGINSKKCVDISGYKTELGKRSDPKFGEKQEVLKECDFNSSFTNSGSRYEGIKSYSTCEDSDPRYRSCANSSSYNKHHSFHGLHNGVAVKSPMINLSRSARANISTSLHDGDDSVFLEAMSLSFLFKQKAMKVHEAADSNDDDDDFLSKCDVPILVSSDSDSEGEQIEQKVSSERNNIPKELPDRKLGRKSFDGVLSNLKQSYGETTTLRRCASTELTSANSIPNLSRDNIRGLGLKTHLPFTKKLNLPVDKAANLKPIKCQAVAQLTKKGPMKAVIPIGSMMRSVAKKVEPVTALIQPTDEACVQNSQPVKLSVKMQPMAESTPSNDRKGRLSFHSSKLFSPIPHSKLRVSSDPSSLSVIKTALQRCSSVAGNIMALKSPPVSLQSANEKHSSLERSKSADTIVQVKLSKKQARPVPEMKVHRRVKSDQQFLHGKSGEVSSPLKSLTKNCKISRLISKPLNRISRAKRSIVTAAEKENARPHEMVHHSSS